MTNLAALNLIDGDLAVSEPENRDDALFFTFEFLSDRGFERLSMRVPADRIATLTPVLAAWLATHHPLGGIK